MNIMKLKDGAKMVWDAPGKIPTAHDPSERFIYAVTIAEKHPVKKMRMVIISTTRFSGGGHWMGPECEYIRTPTDEELKKLTWPTNTF